jgi:hypothetical protein
VWSEYGCIGAPAVFAVCDTGAGCYHHYLLGSPARWSLCPRDLIGRVAVDAS